MGLAAGKLRHERHADRPGGRRSLHRHVVPAPVAPVAACHHFERQPRIADAAGVGPLHRHQHRADAATGGGGAGIEARHAPEARPQSDNAVAIGGDADRAADIVAVRDRCDADGDRSAGAAARTAGRHRGVERIERAAVQAVVGVQTHRERRRVGPADDDRAGMLQIGDDRAVFLRDEVLKRDHAVVGRGAGKVDVDLDGDRHAVQRSEGMAAGPGGVGGLGGSARLGLEHFHDGVDRGIDLVQALQHQIDGLDRGSAAGADEAREVGRVQSPEFGHRTSPSIQSEWACDTLS